MLPLNFQTRGSLIVPDDIDVPLVFPGVRGKIKKTIALPNTPSLEKGSLVIIQPLNLDKPEQEQRFKLTPYTPVGASINDLPENQRNISIDDSKCCGISLQNPAEYLEYGLEQYQQSNAPLFNEGSPSIEDINQGKIPDCFFLASLAAILSQPKGASYIRSMMRQNEDGTTTVRLFNPKTLEPTYVRVQNSYIVDKEGSLSEHKNLWVDILEKAASSVPEFFNNTNQSISGALNGGTESIALKIITGCPSKEKSIDHDTFFAWDIAHYFADELHQQDVWIDIIQHANEEEKPILEGQFKIVMGGSISAKIKVFEHIFGAADAEKTCADLMVFYIDHKDKWEEIYNQYPNTHDRLEQIIYHFSQEEKNEQVVNTLNALLTYYHEDIEKMCDETIIRLLVAFTHLRNLHFSTI